MLKAMFAVLLALLQVVSAQEFEWTRMPGQAKQISVKAEELWALTKYGEVMRWNGDHWENRNNFTVTHVAAATDGYAWLTTSDKESDDEYIRNGISNVYRINLYRNYEFKYAHFKSHKINAVSMVNAVAISFSPHAGQIKRYSFIGNGPRWHLLGNENDRDNLYVAIGDGNEIWKIDLTGRMYNYINDTWRKQDPPPRMGDATYVDVQNPNRVVVTDDNYLAWYWDGRNWTSLPGVECAQATINYKSVYCVDPKYRIWRLDN